MAKIKKYSNLFFLIILVVLASFGIGVAGAVPISNSKKDERSNPQAKEIVVIKNEEEDTTSFNEKQ